MVGVGNYMDIVCMGDGMNILVEIIRRVEGRLEVETEEESGQWIALFDPGGGLNVGIGFHA